MHYTTFNAYGYKGGSITTPNTKTFYAKITVDLHTKNTAHQSAVMHLYSDALLSGAGKYTRETFIDAVTILGGSIGVSISQGYCTFTIRCVQEVSGKIMRLFQTMIESPTFSVLELKRIKTQTINELLEHKEDAKSIAVEQFQNALYTPADRRYSSNTDTLIREINKVEPEDLHELHTLTKNRIWTVTLGSNTATQENVLRTINHCKKGSKEDYTTGIHRQKPSQQKILLSNIPSKQNIEFAIGTSLPMTLHHPDYLPFVFGLNVLGKWGGFNGRLMSTVREKEGLTYGIYAKTEGVSGTEQGHYRIMTFFAPEKAVQGLTSTIREIKKIQKTGITPKEYQRFQVILQTQETLLHDSLQRSIDHFHGYLCADFSIEEMHAYQEKLRTVSKNEINHALKTYLHPEALTISGAGPVQKVRKDLLSIT